MASNSTLQGKWPFIVNVVCVLLSLQLTDDNNELEHLRSSWGGYRSNLSKTLTSIAAILEGDPTSPLSELDVVLLANTLEQLQRKKVLYDDLNKQIAACITDEGELES